MVYLGCSYTIRMLHLDNAAVFRTPIGSQSYYFYMSILIFIDIKTHLLVYIVLFRAEL